MGHEAARITQVCFQAPGPQGFGGQSGCRSHHARILPAELLTGWTRGVDLVFPATEAGRVDEARSAAQGPLRNQPAPRRVVRGSDDLRLPWGPCRNREASPAPPASVPRLLTRGMRRLVLPESRPEKGSAFIAGLFERLDHGLLLDAGVHPSVLLIPEACCPSGGTRPAIRSCHSPHKPTRAGLTAGSARATATPGLRHRPTSHNDPTGKEWPLGIGVKREQDRPPGGGGT